MGGDEVVIIDTLSSLTVPGSEQFYFHSIMCIHSFFYSLVHGSVNELGEVLYDIS